MRIYCNTLSSPNLLEQNSGSQIPGGISILWDRIVICSNEFHFNGMIFSFTEATFHDIVFLYISRSEHLFPWHWVNTNTTLIVMVKLYVSSTTKTKSVISQKSTKIALESSFPKLTLTAIFLDIELGHFW